MNPTGGRTFSWLFRWVGGWVGGGPEKRNVHSVSYNGHYLAVWGNVCFGQFVALHVKQTEQLAKWMEPTLYGL